MIIWLRKGPNPFGFGSTEMIVGTEIDEELYIEQDLGMGFKGYLFNIKGKTFIFEKESGGWVGDTLQQVREDIIACGNRIVMQEQVDDAKAELERGPKRMVSFVDFFEL